MKTLFNLTLLSYDSGDKNNSESTLFGKVDTEVFPLSFFVADKFSIGICQVPILSEHNHYYLHRLC